MGRGATVEYPTVESYRLQEMDIITLAEGHDIHELKVSIIMKMKWLEYFILPVFKNRNKLSKRSHYSPFCPSSVDYSLCIHLKT